MKTSDEFQTRKSERKQVRHHVRRVLANSRTLVSGKAAGAVLSLAYIAIATQHLGPEGFGLMVIMQAYALAVASFLQLGGAAAIQRFGSLALEAGDENHFRELLGLMVGLGIAQLILAPLIVAASAYYLADTVGASRDYVGLMILFALAAPFEKAELPASLLRLLDRFRALAGLLVVSPAVRLLGSGFLVLAGGGLIEFAYVWAGAWVVRGCLVWSLAYRQIRARKLLPSGILMPSRAELSARHPGLIRFMAFTSLSEILRSVTGHLTTLFAGGLISVEAAGYLNIAQRLTNLVGKLPGLVRHTLTPELSRLSARSQLSVLSGLLLRIMGLVVVLGLPVLAIYVVAGRFMISVIAGPEFLSAYAVLIALAANRILRLAAAPLDPAIIALGMAGRDLMSLVMATFMYLVAIWVLAPSFGVLGVGLSLLAFTLCYYGTLAVMIAGELRQQKRHSVLADEVSAL